LGVESTIRETKRKSQLNTKLEEVDEAAGGITMKRSAVAIGAVLLFVACTWALAQEITIGVSVSTTGASASHGIPNQDGLFLVPHVLGGQKVRYIFLDDASDPATTVQNVKRLISQDNIDVLFGPSVAPVTIAIIETIAEVKVPMITFGSTILLVLPMNANKNGYSRRPPTTITGAANNANVREAQSHTESSKERKRYE
jgi:branched-chain amino acid transport system substrate-binding protein